jgi:plastocyanin
MTAGSTVTYPVLTFVPLPTALNGSEEVTLSGTLPSGFALTFSSNPVAVYTYTRPGQIHIPVTINASQSVPPGAYNLNILAKYGTTSTTYDLKVKVVEYLVVIPNNENRFSPQNLTAKLGSTVYWINLDLDTNFDVTFTSGSTAQSGAILPLNDLSQGSHTYSYTFTSIGTYSYHCSSFPPMTGTVTITTNG